MHKHFWQTSWPRLLLWANVLGVAVFYLTLWWRTRPDKRDVVRVLPTKADEHTVSRKEEKTHPLVSIIVPARNEEQNIRRCVQSLLTQDYAHYEVIVVDDGSTDNTGSILHELAQNHPAGKRLRILHLHELPDGWAGKPHAMHCGTQEAQGSWLLFTDADTYHSPNALRSVVTQATQEKLALFTITATQELPTFWERCMMPLAYMGISMLYPPRQVNDPTSSIAIANGQYLLIRREIYDHLGGYARPELRGTVLDDRDMARVVKGQGYHMRFVDGQDLVTVRMYRNLADIWRGWRKNAFLGNRGGVAFVLLQLIGLPMVTIMPFLFPLFARLLVRSGKLKTAESWAISVTALAPLLLYRGWLNRLLRVPQGYTLTHPLAGLLFTGILGESAWRVITRQGVDWRGRQYHGEG